MNKKVASCFYCNIWNRYKRDKKIKLLILNCSLPGLPLGCLDLSPVLLTLPWLYTSKGDILCFLTRLLGYCPVPGVSGESPGAAALWSLSGEGVERQSCCSPWGGDCRAWPSCACDLCEWASCAASSTDPEAESSECTYFNTNIFSLSSSHVVYSLLGLQ